MPTNTVGRPVVGMQISIRDEQKKELPQGEVGILWVKGPNVMLGIIMHQSLRKK